MPYKKYIAHHYDDIIETIASFGGGSGFVLLASYHFNIWDIVGKLTMTIIVGLLGGMSGVYGKYLCNKYIKNQKKKS
jgi:hypothetical protein